MEGKALIRQEQPVRESVPRQGISTGQVVLFEQFRLLRRTWIWILAASIIVTLGVAYLYFIVVPVQYAGMSRAIPPNKQGTPFDNLIGGVASTLKDFGLSKLVGKGGSESGYSRSVILTSNRLFDSLIAKYDLFRVYDIPRNRYDLVYAEIRSNLVVAVEEEGPIGITVYDVDPKRSADMANDVVEFSNRIARELNRQETAPITRYMGEQLDQKRAEQTKLGLELAAFLKKNKLFDVESQGPAIATGLLEAQTTVSAQRQVASMLRSTLGAEDPKTIQAEEALRQAESELARIRQGTESSPSIDNLSSTAIGYIRLRSMYEANQKYLALAEPMHAQSQFDEMRDIPVLHMLDAARVPHKKARPKRAIILASAFVGSLLVAYFVIAIAAYWRNFRRRYNEYAVDDRTTDRRANLPAGDQ